MNVNPELQVFMMNLSQTIKKLIKWFIPYGIIYHRNQMSQRISAEQNLQREQQKEQKEREIKNYFLSLNADVVEDPEIVEIIDYYRKYNRPIYWYPYSFARKYFAADIDVFYDNSSKTKYVLHENKRLYFPKDWDNEYIRIYYNNLRSEQDKDSPHRYEAGIFTIQEGDVIADIGAAEGIWALNYAEKAGKIYLFECGEEWIKALKKTFEPWKDKTVIVDKYVSNINNRNNVTLDNYFDEGIDFIKADIEGMETKLLEGCKNILANNINLKLLLCTYHRKNDAADIKEILEKNGFKTEYSRRYMLCSYDEELEKPYLRRGLIRAVKKI